jgi:YggT family protein
MNELLVAIIRSAYYVVDAVFLMVIIVIIASAVLSWLVAFDVVNLRNRFAYSVAHFLEAVTRPILRPFRRIIPPLGGVDISPMIALLIIFAIRAYILPALANTLIRLVS